MNLSAFHFLRPYALLALLPLGLLLFLLVRRRRRDNPWRSVCDPQLLPHVVEPACGSGRPIWPWIALAFGGLFGILALAGPTWQRRPQPAYLNRSGLVIALDLSASMKAADLKPSRLLRARYKIADILRSRHDGQTGLVVYAGDPFTVTPMTDDTNTIYSQLSVLDTGLMPSQGERADLAVAKAASLLHQAGLRHGDVLLVTDGCDPAKLRPAIRKLRDAGYRLSILGVGTAQGAPVPLPGGGFQQDGHGKVLLSHLQTKVLRRMARLGGGLYRTLTPTDADLHALQALFSRRLTAGASQKARVSVATWREEGPWLLLPLLALAALAFRRGVLLILLLLLFSAPQPARAMSWHGLWRNRDQQGSRALAQGDSVRAAKLFTDPRWKAAACYRAGDYAGVLKALKGRMGKNDWYNRGNALARLGRYRRAVQAYRKALDQDPHFKDARFNKRLVEKLLKKNQQKKKKRGTSRGKPSPQKEGSSGKQQSRQGKEGQGAGGAKRNATRGSKPTSPGTSGQHAGKGKNPSSPSASPSKKGASQSAANRQGGEPSAAMRQKTSTASPPKEGQSSKVETGQKKKRSLSAVAPPPINPATAAQREKGQASRQWLRQVPDDPGGLLRRKFYYEYHQRHPDADQGGQPW